MVGWSLSGSRQSCCVNSKLIDVTLTFAYRKSWTDWRMAWFLMGFRDLKDYSDVTLIFFAMWNVLLLVCVNGDLGSCWFSEVLWEGQRSSFVCGPELLRCKLPFSSGLEADSEKGSEIWSWLWWHSLHLICFQKGQCVSGIRTQESLFKQASSVLGLIWASCLGRALVDPVPTPWLLRSWKIIESFYPFIWCYPDALFQCPSPFSSWS